MMDKLSGFTMLRKANTENRELTFNGIRDWVSLFGVPGYIMSDRGPAFLNETLQQLTTLLQVEHHVTSAATHWSHGKHERAHRILNDFFRKILLENKMESSRCLRSFLSSRC